MNANGSVNLRIGRCHHARHRAACGEARYEHALRIDIVFCDTELTDWATGGRLASDKQLKP
jgi:hypothetical protein